MKNNTTLFLAISALLIASPLMAIQQSDAMRPKFEQLLENLQNQGKSLPEILKEQQEKLDLFELMIQECEKNNQLTPSTVGKIMEGIAQSSKLSKKELNDIKENISAPAPKPCEHRALIECRMIAGVNRKFKEFVQEKHDDYIKATKDHLFGMPVNQ